MNDEINKPPVFINPCEKCAKHEGRSPSYCPYLREINDDSETECNCCDTCYESCADAI